jgi:low molecular weight protein-tyrosine phosphatase
VNLPPPRDGEPYRITFVCLGNICRSPMAAVVMTQKVEAAGLAPRVRIDSSGTGDWHIGDPMDSRAAATLSAAGYDPSPHRAQHFDRNWFDRHDAFVTMDHSNQRDVLSVAPPSDAERVVMFRSFDPQADGDLEVPDPWYGGQAGFDDVLEIVERTTDALLHDVVVILDATT